MSDVPPCVDELALQRLAIDYAYAVDRRDWDLLDDVFVPDAAIDYRATGGTAGTYPEVKTWLARNMRFFRTTMHMMGNFRFEVDGDHARGVIAGYNPMVVRSLFGSRTVLYGFWYHDEYVRTDAGWRIRMRRQEAAYRARVPWWMALGASLVARRERRR